MKINSISIISLISVLSFAANADAGVVADFYVGAMAGVGAQTLFTKDHHSTDSSRLLGAIAGMDIPMFRIEAEYNYIDSSDLNTNTGMLNLYAKIPSTLVLPYIGGGIGMMFGGDHTTTSDSIETKYNIKSTTAYQAMLGATIDILAVPIKFDVEGRVLYAPDIYKIDSINATPDILQYTLRAKVRYIF